MQPEYFVTCGRCQFGVYVLGATDARRSGWRLTKRDGWICPDCASPQGK
jgi:hypothetical protein